MLYTTAADFLEQAGFSLARTKIFPSHSSDAFDIEFSAVPSKIISDIKNTPLRGQISVTDQYHLKEKILRCDTLIFNPKSTLNWHIPPEVTSTEYVAISTNRLVINFPNPTISPCILSLIAPVTKANLNGRVGSQGATGWTSISDNGQPGGDGNPGETGEKGGTYNFPAAFIFFQEITLNIPNPAGSLGLRVTGAGLDGGDGGRGGTGGTGGAGARGTPGDRNCILGICACSAGPGRGGNGGHGGPGGRGGDAGRGGNGVSIFLVGPKSEHAKLDRTEFLLKQGLPGTPGNPGQGGSGGPEGGGGSKPFECVDGGGSGAHGNPSKNDLGSGNINTDGMEGSVFTSDRNNSDLS